MTHLMKLYRIMNTPIEVTPRRRAMLLVLAAVCMVISVLTKYT